MSKHSPKDTVVIPLEDISPNPWNPHGMKPEEFQALRESVREKGAYRPIVVVEMDAGDEFTPVPETRYRIVDGAHLHRALVAEHLEYGGPGSAAVLIYGKNSDVPVDVQMEIGQTINHGMRGTLENTEKTGRIVEVLARTRSIEEIARRTGQNQTYLESARRVVMTPTRAAAAPAVTATRSGGDRKGQTVPLVFEDNATLGRYQNAVKRWEDLMDPDGELTPGRRRIAAVLAALEAGEV